MTKQFVDVVEWFDFCATCDKPLEGEYQRENGLCPKHLAGTYAALNGSCKCGRPLETKSKTGICRPCQKRAWDVANPSKLTKHTGSKERPCNDCGRSCWGSRCRACSSKARRVAGVAA